MFDPEIFHLSPRDNKLKSRLLPFLAPWVSSSSIAPTHLGICRGESRSLEMRRLRTVWMVGHGALMSSSFPMPEGLRGGLEAAELGREEAVLEAETGRETPGWCPPCS